MSLKGIPKGGYVWAKIKDVDGNSLSRRFTGIIKGAETNRSCQDGITTGKSNGHSTKMLSGFFGV